MKTKEIFSGELFSTGDIFERDRQKFLRVLCQYEALSEEKECQKSAIVLEDMVKKYYELPDALPILFDFTHIRYIDATGLSPLLTANALAKGANKRNAGAIIIGLQEHVRRFFAISQVDTVIECANFEEFVRAKSQKF